MINLKNTIPTAAALFLFSLLGCSEFIEPNIEKREVVLLAPANASESNQYSQTFWWEEVEDALQYRLQVVAPNFVNTSRLILDTVIKTNKFNYTLDPGNYEWRIRAENGSSQSPYKTASFVIQPSTIEEQQIQLQSPANRLVTNQSSTVFSWLKLFGADKYRIQIDTANFEDGNVLFLDKTTPNLEYTVAFTKDKVYRWRVKAENATMESKWSVIQTITFDKTPPGEVFPASPTDQQSVARNPTLSWEATADAKKYQLYIFKSDGTSIYSPTFPVTVTGLSYVFTEGKSGESVTWQVRAIDEAGNAGTFSKIRGFSIQ
ncbi:fibronectin type III domain-containing protein [Pedobacter metabolipauper]|uniref:Fibronectin type-III domain-containing protein n=1 Tax=Pedobacter metabolipauper TaxID=425513 RepID=A0A4R6SYC2_9SPHI|nr:hypothetical protein [Pedobacter metabolipauper]TDQ11564.1 hypothetical protein ATK78_0687 [Pedobacter metabolipauper]